MARRGSYAKGVAKRAEIVEAAFDIIGRKDFSPATLKELSDAVGLTPNGVLHYFSSRDDLFTELLRRRDADIGSAPSELTEESFAAALVDSVRYNLAVPGLVQLYARISNEAARPDHPAHDYFARRYIDGVRDIAKVFEVFAQEGRLQTEASSHSLAVRTMALLDGLQTQWMYDRSLDMTAHLLDFLREVGVRSDALTETP